MDNVKLYDTILRDGMGTAGLSLSVGERLKVVQILDELGVQFIEAGFPSSNPKEVELFRLLADLKLKQATICAFGMTRRRDVAADDDAALRTLVDCFAPVVTLVGKTWDLHLENVTKVSRVENLAMITESVAFCRARGKRVIYDAEHFFDGYREDPKYALECVVAAAEAGAENVTLCDTNGASLPEFVSKATEAVVTALGGQATVGIHTHNDAECAVANSLVAVSAGASLVQGTLNGYGERCGNANLASILPALQLKMGHAIVSPMQLEGLSRAAHRIDELCNMTPDPRQPYVGWHAFSHKAGMHASAVQTNPLTFEHIEPELVGNHGDTIPSELAGKGMIRAQAVQAGIELDEASTEKALELLKEREHRGYHYEAAPASFELLLREAAGSRERLFKIKGFRVIIEQDEDGEVKTEATIKLEVGGVEFFEVAYGNGPVNALDRALRKAISSHYPSIEEIELTNYKVRILDEAHGTDAVTRVLLESVGHGDEWETIGVSENIIEASWEALIESLEYALQRPEDGLGAS